MPAQLQQTCFDVYQSVPFLSSNSVITASLASLIPKHHIALHQDLMLFGVRALHVCHHREINGQGSPMSANTLKLLSLSSLVQSHITACVSSCICFLHCHTMLQFGSKICSRASELVTALMLTLVGRMQSCI